MCSDEVIRDQVADAFVKLGGALEIGEQEREAGDVEALIDVERIGAIEVMECLIGEQALCRQEGLAPAEKAMERVPGDPHARQYPCVGAILECEAKRAGPQLYCSGRRPDLVENEREVLALARRLPFDVEELRRVRHRFENNHELRRQLQR